MAEIRALRISPKVGKTPAVALVNPKFAHNVGSALRACSCYRVAQLWWSGDRVSTELTKRRRLPREERMKGYKAVELCHGDYFFDAFGRDVTPIAVELRRGAEDLTFFEHPDNALYVFGPEDGSLGRAELSQCHRVVYIPALHCLNLAAAVYTVLYDRYHKRVMEGREVPLQLAEHRGFIEPESMEGIL